MSWGRRGRRLFEGTFQRAPDIGDVDGGRPRGVFIGVAGSREHGARVALVAVGLSR